MGNPTNGSSSYQLMTDNFYCRVRNLPVTRDGLKGTVVSAQWDVESNDGLASLDEVEVLLLNAGLTSGFVVEELDLLEETGFVVLIELGAELGLSGEGSHGD